MKAVSTILLLYSLSLSVYANSIVVEREVFAREVFAREALPQEAGPGPKPGPPGREGKAPPPNPPNPPGQQPVEVISSSSTTTISTTTTTSSVSSQTSLATEPIQSFSPRPSLTSTSLLVPLPTTSIPTLTLIPLPTTSIPTLTLIPLPSTSLATLTQTRFPIVSSSSSMPLLRLIETASSSVASSTTLTGAPQPTLPALDSIVVNENYRSRQILVIVLSVVLGSVGIILVTLVLFLICRYRKRRSFRRGVSPINDEEIESWRGSEKKLSLSSPREPNGNYSSPTSPEWTWSNVDGLRSPPPSHTRGPSLTATAPNARLGLTTEIVPGAEPFVPAVKRQSSRLSKGRSHARTKSMRSSSSAKSTRSLNGDSVAVIDFTMTPDGIPDWFTNDTRTANNHFRVSTTAGTTSSPGTSIYGGLSELGGLSPRPKPLVFSSFNEPGGLSPRPIPRQSERSTQTPTDAPAGWPISWS